MALITNVTYILITLIVTFAILVFLNYLLNPFDSDETVARSMSLELSSIVNAMENAPPETTRNYSLPARECAVHFTGTAINSSVGNSSFESPIMIPEYPIEIRFLENFVCDSSSRRIITFLRMKGTAERPDSIEVSYAPEEE